MVHYTSTATGLTEKYDNTMFVNDRYDVVIRGEELSLEEFIKNNADKDYRDLITHIDKYTEQHNTNDNRILSDNTKHQAPWKNFDTSDISNNITDGEENIAVSDALEEMLGNIQFVSSRTLSEPETKGKASAALTDILEKLYTDNDLVGDEVPGLDEGVFDPGTYKYNYNDTIKEIYQGIISAAFSGQMERWSELAAEMNRFIQDIPDAEKMTLREYSAYISDTNRNYGIKSLWPGENNQISTRLFETEKLRAARNIFSADISLNLSSYTGSAWKYITYHSIAYPQDIIKITEKAYQAFSPIDAAAAFFNLSEKDLQEALDTAGITDEKTRIGLTGVFTGLQAELKPFLDRPVFDVMQHFYDQERKAFLGKHPVEIIKAPDPVELTGFSTKDYIKEMICNGNRYEGNSQMPFIFMVNRTPDELKEHADAVKEILYDAAGLLPLDISDKAISESGYDTAEKLSDFIYKRELENINDFFHRPCPAIPDDAKRIKSGNFKDPFKDMPETDQAEFIKRLDRIRPEELDMFDNCGLSDNQTRIKAMLSLPLDREGIPRFNRYISDIFHKNDEDLTSFAYAFKDRTRYPVTYLTDYPQMMDLVQKDFELMKDIDRLCTADSRQDHKMLQALNSIAADIIDNASGNVSSDTTRRYKLMLKNYSIALGMFRKLNDLPEHNEITSKLLPTEDMVKTLSDIIRLGYDRDSKITELQGLELKMTDYADSFTAPDDADIPDHSDEIKNMISENRDIIKHISDSRQDMIVKLQKMLAEEKGLIEKGEKITPYRSRQEKELDSLFRSRYHFAPKIIPMLAEVCRTDRDHSGLKILSPERIVSDFNRNRISQTAAYINPATALLALECPIEKLTVPVKDMITRKASLKNINGIIENFDIISDKKNWSMPALENVLDNIDTMDRESLKILSTLSAAEYKSITEARQSRVDIKAYEHDYHYSFSNNRLDISDKDLIAEDHKRHLRAYILAPDDIRNYTVGYDTDCCQHYAGAGEDCTFVATASPDSGIWVIENTDTGKIEAQAWIYEDHYYSTFVFDNIEFANDQKVEQYQDILSAYVNSLSDRQVHMGTGYNVMTGIGEKLDPKKDHYIGSPKYYEDEVFIDENDLPGDEHRAVYVDEYEYEYDGNYYHDDDYDDDRINPDDIEEAYSDYSREDARILKRNGELLMTECPDIEIKRETVPSHNPEYDMVGGAMIPYQDSTTAHNMLDSYRTSAIDYTSQTMGYKTAEELFKKPEYDYDPEDINNDELKKMLSETDSINKDAGSVAFRFDIKKDPDTGDTVTHLSTFGDLKKYTGASDIDIDINSGKITGYDPGRNTVQIPEPIQQSINQWVKDTIENGQPYFPFDLTDNVIKSLIKSNRDKDEPYIIADERYEDDPAETEISENTEIPDTEDIENDDLIPA